MRPGADRYDYAQGELTEKEAGDDPLTLFARWLEDARRASVVEPTAFCLSTASPDGAPSARFLLLRGHDARGFVFYSHYEGRKGRDLAENPRAAMTFWWAALERQIRVEGRTERLPDAESDAYWASRPAGSRAASAASPQSEVIPNREWLEARVAEDHPQRPEGWGGTLLIPERIEFWQGRLSRLHDRFVYAREGDVWTRARLAP